MSGRPDLLLLRADDGTLEHSIANLDIALTVVNDVAGLLAHLQMAEGLIMSAAHLSEDLVDRLRLDAPRLHWVHLVNAGHDMLNEGSFRQDQVVTFTPGAGAMTVAEHGLAFMLALARRIPDALDQQRARHWNQSLANRLVSLRGRTVTILGFGHIGKALAQLTRAFGMHVIAVSRSEQDSELADVSCMLADLETYLPLSDFVVIAAPLNAETDCLFDETRLGLIRPDAFLINLSRGGIVDLDALSRCLVQRTIAGAALDVTTPEPLPAEHPIWAAPNLIITPHLAATGASPMDRRTIIDLTTENARRFASGEALLNLAKLGSSMPAGEP